MFGMFDLLSLILVNKDNSILTPNSTLMSMTITAFNDGEQFTIRTFAQLLYGLCVFNAPKLYESIGGQIGVGYCHSQPPF
jgi:hypothetical protein